MDNNEISNTKPGKFRQRSYDNLKTGKLNVHRSNDRRCVLPKSPYISRIHNENNDGNLRTIRPVSMEANRMNRIFSPSDERTYDRDERLSFIEATNDRMAITSSSSSSSTTTSTSSSLSSLASLSSPSHSTSSHIKLKSLIPTQYRVYIPQKKCEMKQAYTDYVYSTDQSTNQVNQTQRVKHNKCPKQSAHNNVLVGANAT